MSERSNGFLRRLAENDEREKCAKVCDDLAVHAFDSYKFWTIERNWMEAQRFENMRNAYREAAALIRMGAEGRRLREEQDHE